MSVSTRTASAARRDAGIRRLRALNRLLIGAAVAGTGLLTDVAANAFPGHKRRAAAPTVRPAPARAAPARATTRHHRRARHHHALAPPAQAPTTPTTPTTSAPAPASPAPAPATPVPAPQPVAPAPVVSGGS